MLFLWYNVLTEENIMDKIKIGDIVFGKVTGIEKYGIFLSLDDNINGLIHISDISNSFIKNINDSDKIVEHIKL